jgi:hypothetical protein
MFVSEFISSNVSVFDSVILACGSYHLPAHVAPHVDLVTPTVHFNTIISRSPEPSHHEIRSTSDRIKLGVPGQGFDGPKTSGNIQQIFHQLEHCDKQITPLCLRALYGFVSVPLKAKDNSYAIGECLYHIDVPNYCANHTTYVVQLNTRRRLTFLMILTTLQRFTPQT